MSTMSQSLDRPWLDRPNQDWERFRIVEEPKLQLPPRPLNTTEGIADRVRLVAFAELQAREAFLWAAERFKQEAPDGLCQVWTQLAQDEQKHYTWLIDLMMSLSQSLDERPVCTSLWRSLMNCKTAEEFAFYICNAEERGRIAGHRFAESLRRLHPRGAEVFQKIADEEVAHVQVAQRFFPHLPVPTGEARKS